MEVGNDGEEGLGVVCGSDGPSRLAVVVPGGVALLPLWG